MPDIICISPIDGREVARRATATATEIERALAAARAAQREWARTPIAERAPPCCASSRRCGPQNPEVTRELALQMGRPVRYGGEFRSLEERVRYMVAIAADALAPVVPAPKAGFTRYIRRDPLGLVLTIAPWNYPYLTAVNTVVPGLMAGNAVILKAASQTILTGERFQAAMDKAGLPKGLFQHLVLARRHARRSCPAATSTT